MTRNEASNKCLEIWNDQSKSVDDRKCELREFLTKEEIKYKHADVRSFLKKLQNAGIPQDVLSSITLLITLN